MGSARNAEQAFFPLDDELELLPGTLTPSLQEDLVRLGAWMPFGRAAQELQHVSQVAISRPTVERITEAAGAVGAVTDGAEWIPKFVDQQRYDAVRILDFPHAGEHLSNAGEAVWGEGSAEAQSWFETQLHDLKHTGPASVLAELRRLVGLKPEQARLVDDLEYLEKRQAQMQYPLFQAAGWPIGDGAVESGNKLVVEARLKGSGTHWARAQVDPMVALRNIVCSDRWAEACPQITQTLRQQARQRRSARHQKRRQAAQPLPALTANLAQPAAAAQLPAWPILADVAKTQLAPSQMPPKTTATEPWRPPPNHPWRHMPVGRARFESPLKNTDAKP